MKGKRILFVIGVTLIVITVITVCYQREYNDEALTVTFAETINVDVLKEYEGKQISITGFMALSSPIDGSMAYIMNMPYQSCAYCVPNSSELVNTIAVYPPRGNSLPYYETAITVKGNLVFKTTTDDLGYTYDYYLTNTTIEEYIPPAGEVNYISVYNQLIENDFATLADKLLSDIYIVTNLGQQDIEPYTVDLSIVYEMKGILNEYDNNDITSANELMYKLEDLIVRINIAIEENDLELLMTYHEEGQAIYNLLYEWLTSPKV